MPKGIKFLMCKSRYFHRSPTSIVIGSNLKAIQRCRPLPCAVSMLLPVMPCSTVFFTINFFYQSALNNFRHALVPILINFYAILKFLACVVNWQEEFIGFFYCYISRIVAEFCFGRMCLFIVMILSDVCI